MVSKDEPKNHALQDGRHDITEANIVIRFVALDMCVPSESRLFSWTVIYGILFG